VGAVTVRAAVYTRMSLARMDDQTKVTDQERICRGLAQGRGWEIAGVYSDNNKSAWRRDRKRPGWDAMLADINAGKLTAIIVYHGDRLIRQPFDLELLINLADARGIRLASPTGERSLDSAEDRFVLRIEAAMACRESDNISRRKKAQYQRDVRAGRPHTGGRGGRPFGYATDGITQVPAECGLLREMAARILAGETCGSVARDITARGHRTAAGAVLRHETVRNWLSSPRYAGLMPDGESAAGWEPVLDRETHERLRLVLDMRGKDQRGKPSLRRWLLSGIATCGKCGTPLEIRRGRAARRPGEPKAIGYACPWAAGSHVFRSARLLDAYVLQRAVSLLNDPRNPPGEIPAPDHAPEWAALGRERAEAERLLASYEGSPGRARLLMARLDSIDARITQLRDLADTSARDALAARYHGITLTELQEAPLDVRRALVAALLRVEVLPASRRGPGFRTEDIRVTPR
jgi:DNA invertase Pin-like site-specific DNA recombinase